MELSSTRRDARLKCQRAFAVAMLATPTLSPRAPAQARGTIAVARLTGEWAVEQQGRERWLQGRQQPRSTRFTTTHDWIIVDSIRDASADRRIWLTLARNAYGRDSALIVVAPTGRVSHIEFGRAPMSGRPTLFLDDSTRREDFQRRGPEGNLTLGESRLWDLVPTAPPRAPRVGLVWRDTIDRVATEGEFRQAMRGTRTSRIIGERAVAGRSLWIVRDSAVVTYDEQYPERERTLAGARVSRTASGPITGTHLWDPALRLSRQSDDTTLLSGQAVLHYADGRSFRTPARFERTRHRTLLDAPAYASRIAELRSTGTRGSGGLVMNPDSSLTSRLLRGDTTARNSLLSAWQRAADPDSAWALFATLAMWAQRDARTRSLMDSIRLAAADTAYLYTRLSEKVEWYKPVDIADVRAMLPFMEDPGLAWRFNLSRDEPYENLVQALTAWPPAAAAGSGWPYQHVGCTPVACRLLADQWHSAREPRLRDVGLIALLILDPARWADTVLALDGPRHPLLHDAALLARGVGATWPAASKAPMPPPNSDWHAWLEWMDGRDSRYVALKRQSSLPRRFNEDTLPQVRFEESHVAAIRFYQARTGRDIVAELRHRYDSAPSDSARLVFGTMLEGLGAIEPIDSLVVAGFRSGDPAQVALARRMLPAAFEKSVLADSSVSAQLLERLLDAIVDSKPLWPNNEPGPEGARGQPTTLSMPHGRIALDTLGLPPRIRAEWGSRVELISQTLWNERDVREPSVYYRIDPIATWGHFARVQVTATQRFARPAGERPQPYAAGATYWLMNVDGHWVIVAESRWVT